MKLKIRYRSSDEVTDRVISDIALDPPKMINALCDLRGERRSFVIGRMESAINLDTGEVIEDIAEFFGLPSVKPSRSSRPKFDETPSSISIDDAQRQRKKDKSSLFKPFKVPAIAEIARRKLFDLFRNRCFKCGSTSRLEFDHHVPQYLGGRLVPGNLVILCSLCNAAKHDSHPAQFYSPEQLKNLEPFLDAELKIFEFQFDWTRWNGHRDQYLLSLGASPEFVKEVMTNKESPLFSGKNEENEYGITISVSRDDISKKEIGSGD